MMRYLKFYITLLTKKINEQKLLLNVMYVHIAFNDKKERKKERKKKTGIIYHSKLKDLGMYCRSVQNLIQTP